MLFSKIDLLSPPITLYYNSGLRHSSPFSGIFTIVSYATIVSFCIYFATDLIERQNPSAFYFNRYVENAGFFPLNSDSMFNFIQILDTESNSPRPVDFNSFRIFGIRQQVELYTASDRDLSKMEHWLYGKCNNDSDIKGIEYLITMNYFNESACIRKYYNKEEKKYYNTNEKGFIWPSLDKGCSHPDRTFYGIIVEQCRNDSLKNDCKPIEEIRDYAAIHAVGFQIIDHYADVYNYKNPLTKYFYNIQNGIYADSYTTNHLNFNPITVKTHNGYFFDNQIEELSYYFDQNEKVTTSWQTENEGVYVAFYFWMQNKMQYYERTYQRIQNVLADMSGMCNAILFIASTINKLISNYVTIIDTEKILIKSDNKNVNNTYITENNFQETMKKTQRRLVKWDFDDEKTSQSDIGNNQKKSDISVNNIIDKNDKLNQSGKTKNVMSNNYLVNNNNLFKIINQEKLIRKPSFSANKNMNTYQPIKKIAFNFLDYLEIIICNHRNQILIYEKFRRKVISEESIIQNYLDMYKLLNIADNQNDSFKMKSKYRMSRIISSVGK